MLQIAEIIDERPEEVKQLEVFRASNKWKVLGGEALKIELLIPFIPYHRSPHHTMTVLIIFLKLNFLKLQLYISCVVTILCIFSIIFHVTATSDDSQEAPHSGTR